jgi:cytochrome c
MMAIAFSRNIDLSANLSCHINHNRGSLNRRPIPIEILPAEAMTSALLMSPDGSVTACLRRRAMQKPARKFVPKPQSPDPMNKLTLSALVVIATSSLASAALAQDAAAGKTSFNKCLPCHSIGEGAKNKVGPELNGLDGRKSGTAEGYNYSDANKNSGITWNEAQFKEYIKDPKAKVPGTKMTFAGIKNENEINNLWAYVSSFDKDGKQKQ